MQWQVKAEQVHWTGKFELKYCCCFSPISARAFPDFTTDVSLLSLMQIMQLNFISILSKTL